LGSHAPTGDPPEALVPPGRPAEPWLDPLAHLVHVFDLHPAGGLSPTHDSRGPDPVVAAREEPERPEAVPPEVRRAHQPAGPAGRWGIQELQDGNVLHPLW